MRPGEPKRFGLSPWKPTTETGVSTKSETHGPHGTVSFNLIRGTPNRVPLEIRAACHVGTLEKLLSGEAKAGSLTLWKSRKGTWYVSCTRCGRKAHADGQAAQNIRDYGTGRFSPLILEASKGGPNDAAPNKVKPTAAAKSAAG